jgi:hypothetical protein
MVLEGCMKSFTQILGYLEFRIYQIWTNWLNIHVFYNFVTIDILRSKQTRDLTNL